MYIRALIINIIYGRGSVIGHALAGNPKVGMVSLTGSVAAGQQIMLAAAPNITKVSLELGGKAPAIVLKDADIDLAVKSIDQTDLRLKHRHRLHSFFPP